MGRGQSDHNQEPKAPSRALSCEGVSTSHAPSHLTDPQIADCLKELNDLANGGRGHGFMLDVIFALRKSDHARAKAIYVHDRDKLELYSTELRDAADRLLGLELT